jgi:hypothetical protein
MTLWPVVLIYGTTALIGAYLGFQYLMGVRNRPTLIGIHLLLGAMGMEVVLMLLRGAPDGTAAAPGGLGTTVALLFGGSLLTGLMVPLLARPMPRIVGPGLALHASVATAGIAAMAWWVMHA